MINKSLAVGIIFLFIVSSTTPMVIGYDVETADRELMDDLTFDCYDRYNSSRVSYYREYLQGCSSDGDLESDRADFLEESDVKKITENVEIEPNVKSVDGPTDSPWPMKYHDAHHLFIKEPSIYVGKSISPKPIFGTAVYINGDSADGASVSVTSSEGTKTTTVGPAGGWPTGYWQVDVGDPYLWPSGISFTVTIMDDSWQGSASGIVQDSYTDVGEIVLYAITIVADAMFDEGCYLVGDIVQFYGNIYGGEPPYDWYWDFGDGGTSRVQNPLHQFNSAGSFNISLTVIDSLVQTDTDTILLIVNPFLSVDAGESYSAHFYRYVQLFGSASGGCQPYSYSWDFDERDGIQEDSTEQNPYPVYDVDGVYTVTLAVTDVNGNTAIDTATVSIYIDNILYSPWPMKSHDTHHTGRSPYSTADNHGTEKWRFKTDSWIEGGPIIDKYGTIYFGAFDQYLYALYPDGILKWKYNTNAWIWSTPATAEDGTIYIGSWDCSLHAIHPNGIRKWIFSAGQVISSSPAISDDGTIYFGVMGPGPDKGRVYAVNPNGTEKWHFDTGYWVVSDPAIGDDGTIYIGSGDGYLYALYPNGTLRWRFKTGGYVKSHPTIADDGTIYFDSFDGYLYALYPNGTMKWRTGGGGSYVSSAPIAQDGTIYDAGDKYLYAIYPNGTRKWSFYLGSSATHIGHSSPAIGADGTVYIGTSIGEMSGGDIIAINPDGTERWRKRIANNWVESSPCIGADGTVYIGSSSDGGEYGSCGHLHAFGHQKVNNPPNKPIIGGKFKGAINTEYRFVIKCNGDPDNNPVSYYIDWGDGTNSGWKYDYTSHYTYFSHTYTKIGLYTIRAKTGDDFGGESDWATMTISMPKNKIINPLFLRVLQNHPQMFPTLRLIFGQQIFPQNLISFSL